MTVSWLAAGPTADNYTIDQVNLVLRGCRDNDLIYDAASGKGLGRLNLFCGAAIADAMIPQIRISGGATDTNNSLVAADYNNKGSSGGFTSGTTAQAKHIDTNTTISDLGFASGQGGFGMYVLTDFATAPAAEVLMGAWDDSDLHALRVVSGDAQGWVGSGAEAGDVRTNFDVGMWSVHRSAGNQLDLYWGAGASLGTSPSAIAIGDTARDFFIFARGDVAAQYAQNCHLGAYFMWRGDQTATDRTNLNTLLDNFMINMGRA